MEELLALALLESALDEADGVPVLGEEDPLESVHAALRPVQLCRETPAGDLDLREAGETIHEVAKLAANPCRRRGRPARRKERLVRIRALELDERQDHAHDAALAQSESPVRLSTPKTLP